MTIHACAVAFGFCAAPPASAPAIHSRDELIRSALSQLIEMQEPDGAWSYEGVYRVAGEIPIGYRVGGTSIVAGAIMHAASPGDGGASQAVQRGLDYVLNTLDHPLMAPSIANAYDVRVWGHGYALEFLCQVRAAGRTGERRREVDAWIPRLVQALITEELTGGGWNYAGRRQHAAFVTAPLTQALLLARSQGEKVPDELLERCGKVLAASRVEHGGFLYSGVHDGKGKGDARSQVPGSIARSPVCETTLLLLGAGSVDALQASLDAFHEHWNELQKRRRKSGTHAGPYGIAPYYFYYGHRYAAQAIQMLPAGRRATERDRLLEVILRTRDDNGTWNDRVFPRSANFGTAMIALALLGDRAPLPPPLKRGAASAPSIRRQN